MDIDLHSPIRLGSDSGSVAPEDDPGAVGAGCDAADAWIPQPRTSAHDRTSDASAGVAALAAAVGRLADEGVLPVGLDAGERPIADVAGLLESMAQVEAVLSMRMAAAEAGGSLPFLSAGGMASQAYWSRARARSLSRAGRLANERPDIGAAWLAGTITAEHVDAAAKGVSRLAPELANAVLNGLTPLWGQVTPASVANYCARARAIVNPPPGDPDLRAQKAYESRFLAFSVLDDTVHITGSLPRLDGELLMNTLRSTAERSRVAGDGLTATQRRADALMQVASKGTAVSEGAAAGSAAGSGAPMSVTLISDLGAATASGFSLDAADTRFVLCDPVITAVVTEAGHTGPSATDSPESTPGIDIRRLSALTAEALASPQPLAVGRTQRVATTAQRRALAMRDGGCIMPGCGVPSMHCQIHHLQPWTDGGSTDLPNLVSLCWAHHRQVDLGRWDIQPAGSRDSGTPASNGAPFTITVRPRSRWGGRQTT